MWWNIPCDTKCVARCHDLLLISLDISHVEYKHSEQIVWCYDCRVKLEAQFQGT